MKYKVGDKVKIVDSTREEDSIYGFTDGEVVTIKDCYVDRPRYTITNGDTTGYIDECNLTDLNSYTWEDFLKAPIGTKITYENGEIFVKDGNGRFENEIHSTTYEIISFNKEGRLWQNHKNRRTNIYNNL